MSVPFNARAIGRPDADPGWRPALRGIVPLSRRHPDGLIALRSVFLAFVLALCLIGVVVTVIGDTTDGDPRPRISLPIVLFVAAGSLLASTFVARSLHTSSAEALANSYRSRFFLRLALAEVPALAAFAVSVAFGPTWVYFVGLAFALLGMYRMAPTVQRLAKEQQQLSLNGCRWSLVAALRGLPVG